MYKIFLDNTFLRETQETLQFNSLLALLFHCFWSLKNQFATNCCAAVLVPVIYLTIERLKKPIKISKLTKRQSY